MPLYPAIPADVMTLSGIQTSTGSKTFDADTGIAIFSGASGVPLLGLYDEDNAGVMNVYISGGQAADINVAFPASGTDYVLATVSTTQTFSNKTINTMKTGTTFEGKPVLVGNDTGSVGTNQATAVTLSAQVAAITPAVTITNTIPAGMYAVYYFLECDAAGSGTASITLTVNYTDRGGADSQTSGALAVTNVGNEVAGVFVFRAHSGDVSYQTADGGGSYTGGSSYALTLRLIYLGA